MISNPFGQVAGIGKTIPSGQALPLSRPTTREFWTHYQGVKGFTDEKGLTLTIAAAEVKLAKPLNRTLTSLPLRWLHPGQRKMDQKERVSVTLKKLKSIAWIAFALCPFATMGCQPKQYRPATWHSFEEENSSEAGNSELELNRFGELTPWTEADQLNRFDSADPRSRLPSTATLPSRNGNRFSPWSTSPSRSGTTLPPGTSGTTLPGRQIIGENFSGHGGTTLPRGNSIPQFRRNSTTLPEIQLNEPFGRATTLPRRR
jgi:hypothetical protein